VTTLDLSWICSRSILLRWESSHTTRELRRGWRKEGRWTE